MEGSDLESGCARCSDLSCLGMHEWTDVSNFLGGISAEDIDSLLKLASPCQGDEKPRLPPPKKARFYSATEAELESAAKGVVPKNTQSNNRWAMNNFEAWRTTYNTLHSNVPIGDDILLTTDSATLDACLARFVVETRKEDGSTFPAKTIKLILSGLQRYMRANSAAPFNIFDTKDHHFRNFHSTCDTVFKKLLSAGVGAEVRHHEPFTPEEENVFWEKGIFGTDSPTALQNAVFFYNGKNLCLRGREEHRSLKRSQFIEFERGYRYVEHGSKTFQGGFNQQHLEGNSVVIYKDADAGVHCYCSLLGLYLSKLPSADHSGTFYLQPVKGTPKPDRWYRNTPVGRNTLNIMVKRMCLQAGLKPRTNHSLRSTGATTLFNAGVPEKLVQEVTGHRSIECLRRYENTSEQHKQAVSLSMT